MTEYHNPYKIGQIVKWDPRPTEVTKLPEGEILPDFLDSGYKCPTCGIVWKGAMAYSCPNNMCPVQPKAIC